MMPVFFILLALYRITGSCTCFCCATNVYCCTHAWHTFLLVSCISPPIMNSSSKQYTCNCSLKDALPRVCFTYLSFVTALGYANVRVCLAHLVEPEHQIQLTNIAKVLVQNLRSVWPVCIWHCRQDWLGSTAP